MTSLAALVMDVRPARTPKRKPEGLEEPMPEVVQMCLDCGATKTPLWRWDPSYEYGVRRLCNRCGCRAARLVRKQSGLHKRSSRDVDGDDDQQWESNWRNASASSSEEDSDSPPTQETTSMRPKRSKRPIIRDDEDVGDAWVTIETFQDEDKPKRQRHPPRRPRMHTDSRRQSQVGARGGKEGVISIIGIHTFRKPSHPRKQSSPYRAL